MIFNKIQLPQQFETVSSVAYENLDVLKQCKMNGTRYRVRRGLLAGGENVVLIQEAKTFIDKLFSYLPSSCCLRNRFVKETLLSIGDSLMSRKAAEDLAKIGGVIPYMPIEKLVEAYCSREVYNPWDAIIRTNLALDFCTTGSDARCDKINSNEQIGFYEKGKPNDIFSNMHRSDGKLLCFIDFPGHVSTAVCSENLFQAGKYYSKPGLRKEILEANCGTNALKLAKPRDGIKADDDFYDRQARRDLSLMLKVVRTRAQQDPVFRDKLVATGKKMIFESTPNDGKWGIVYSSANESFNGMNYLGNILMQVREEVNNNRIPEMSTEEVRASKGIKIEAYAADWLREERGVDSD